MKKMSSMAIKSGMLSIGRIISGLSAVLISMLLTRVLTERDFSTFSQCMMVYRVAVPFLSLGIPSVLLFLLPMEPDRKRAVLLESLLLLFLLGAAFSLFLYLGGGRLLARQFNNPELEQALKWFSLYPAFFLPLVGFGACMTACDQVARFLLFNGIFRAIPVIAVGISALMAPTPISALMALTVSAVITFFPGIWLMVDACGRTRLAPQLQSIRRQLKFALPTMGAGVIGRLQLELDRIFIASYCSVTAFSQYTIASQNLFFVPVLIGSVSSVLRVELTTLYREGNLRGLEALWQSAVVKTAGIIFPIVFFCFFSSRDLIVFLFTSTYAESVVAFRILLVIPLLRSANFSSVSLASGKPGIVTRVLFFTVIGGILLNFILVPAYGYPGAAVATVMTAYLIEVPLHVFYLKKQLGISLFSGFRLQRLVKVLIAAGSPGVVYLLSPCISLPPFIRLVIFALLYGTGLCVAYHFLGIFRMINLHPLQYIGARPKKNHESST